MQGVLAARTWGLRLHVLCLGSAWRLVMRDAGRTAEESAAELVRLMLSRGLIARTERKYKRPKPGRTRLVKWPRTLLFVKVRAASHAMAALIPTCAADMQQ